MSKPKYYNYDHLFGYKCDVIVAISVRGIGKTLDPLRKLLHHYIKTGRQFVYVVETDEMVDTLSAARGERFFNGILDVCINNPSVKNNKLLTLIRGASIDGDVEITRNKGTKKAPGSAIRGGVVYDNDKTMGYLLSYNAFSEIKRNNFPFVDFIFVDEIVPEKLNARNIDMTRKVVSLAQSIGRTRKVKIIMAGNVISMNNPLFIKMKLQDMKRGEIRTFSDKQGLLMVVEFVDHTKYTVLREQQEQSTAGRLARIWGETALDDAHNMTKCPEDLLAIKPKVSSCYILTGLAGSVRIYNSPGNSWQFVTLDLGLDTKYHNYCVDKKFANEKVAYDPEIRRVLLDKLYARFFRFDSDMAYEIFVSSLTITK